MSDVRPGVPTGVAEGAGGSGPDLQEAGFWLDRLAYAAFDVLELIDACGMPEDANEEVWQTRVDELRTVLVSATGEWVTVTCEECGESFGAMAEDEEPWDMLDAHMEGHDG